MVTAGVKIIDAVNTLRPTMTTDLNRYSAPLECSDDRWTSAIMAIRDSGLTWVQSIHRQLRNEELHQAMKNAIRSGDYYIVVYRGKRRRYSEYEVEDYFRFWGWD